MRFHWNNQRSITYGRLSITVCIANKAYMPTNDEVLELAREIFGLPNREVFEKLTVRLYWHENVRIFECVVESLVRKKLFRDDKYDYDLGHILEEVSEAGGANGWIGTMGNNRIDKTYGMSLVKVVE